MPETFRYTIKDHQSINCSVVFLSSLFVPVPFLLFFFQPIKIHRAFFPYQQQQQHWHMYPSTEQVGRKAGAASWLNEKPGPSANCRSGKRKHRPCKSGCRARLQTAFFLPNHLLILLIAAKHLVLFFFLLLNIRGRKVLPACIQTFALSDACVFFLLFRYSAGEAAIVFALKSGLRRERR